MMNYWRPYDWYYDGYFPTQPPIYWSNQPQGWICPSCKKVHAPFIPSCDCHIKTTTKGTTE